MATKKDKGYDPKDKFSNDGFEIIYNPNKKKEQKPQKPKTKK